MQRLGRWCASVLAPRAALAAGGLLLSVAACSLLVENQSQQCIADNDCAQFDNAHCDLIQHVCVSGPPCDTDGSCECNPTTNDQFLNACTGSTCVAFDHARVAKRESNGKLPPLPSATRPFHASVYDAGIVHKSCAEFKKPVYIEGPNSLSPLLTVLGKALSRKEGITIIFQQTSSCPAIQSIIENQRFTQEPGAVYFDGSDSDGNGKPCDVEKLSTGLPHPDIGVSDVFPETCSKFFPGYAKGIQEQQGPVQAMVFVVPEKSTQQVISREAAYLVYGFGSKSGVSPWTNGSLIFDRDPTSGTENMIAASIQVEVDKWMGVITSSTGDEIDKLEAATKDANSAIGVVAADSAAGERGKLRVLAYQDENQSCGYWPDSTPDSLDKANVRDGHYAIWGPIHLAYHTSQPDEATTVLNYLTGHDIDIDLVTPAAKAHLVPQCAMHVQRTKGDGTDMTPFTPEIPCDCFFERAATGRNDCTSCVTDDGCANVKGAPRCRFGYCEPS